MDASLAAVAAGAFALVAFALYIREASARKRAEARLAPIEAELQALKNRSEKHEFRIERFDLVWYPVVTVDPNAKTIQSAAPGVPHCKACILPLVLEKDAWACRQCGTKHAASLADLAVTDQIVRTALQYFQERHPGYRVAKA